NGDGKMQKVPPLMAAMTSVMMSGELYRHRIPEYHLEQEMASNLRLVSEQVEASSFYRLDARVMAIPAALEPSRRFRMERDGFGLPTLLDDISGYDPERFIALKNEFCEYFPEFRTIHLQTELAATRTHQALGLYQSGVAPGKGIYFETRAGATVRAQQASDGAILFLGFLSLFYLPTPPKLLLIEEPETGVYPKRLNQIIDILRKMVGSPFNEKLPQIVFTTHSPYVLTTFKPEEVTFMSKQNGTVVARPLRDAPHIDERLGDGEFYLGELWYNLDEEELFQDAGRPSGA
ncbi:MAG: AAA family ATPase, partial [Isosphaeraceae bacterium]